MFTVLHTNSIKATRNCLILTEYIIGLINEVNKSIEKAKEKHICAVSSVILLPYPNATIVKTMKGIRHINSIPMMREVSFKAFLSFSNCSLASCVTC